MLEDASHAVTEEAVICHSGGLRLCPRSSAWCDFMTNRWEEVSGPSVLPVTSTPRTSGGDLWERWRSSLQPVVFLWQHCGIFTHRDRMSGILGKHFVCDRNYSCCWGRDCMFLSLLEHINFNIGNDRHTDHEDDWPVSNLPFLFPLVSSSESCQLQSLGSELIIIFSLWMSSQRKSAQV